MFDIPTPTEATTRSRMVDEPLQRVGAETYDYGEELNEIIPVLFRTGNVPRAKYEPLEGAYLGAWLDGDESLRMFEYQAEKRHTVYVHEMRIGDDVPTNWILHCIAAMATPLFVIHPMSSYDMDYGIPAEELIYLARQLGSFNLPMFIAFHPPGHGMAPAEFNNLFRYARSVFLLHAPQAAFVWVAPNTEATPQSPFYPGHDAVDWVGASLLAGRCKEGKTPDILAKFEPFHNAFQAHKPIMILPLGISHFSRGDYNFRISETVAELHQTYEALRNFPRVGLIVYADSFSLSPSTQDDFSISGESRLMNAYRDVVACEHFLSRLETNVPPSPIWVRSEFLGYYREGDAYVNIRTLENELRIAPPRQQEEINGQNYANIQVISSYNNSLNISFCAYRRVIFVGA